MTRVLLFVVSVLMGAGPYHALPVNASSSVAKGSSSMGLVDTCSDKQGPDKYACYETALLSIVNTAGVATAMDVLSVVGVLDEDVQRDGHVYAHAIGITGFQSAPDMATTFSRCSELYQSGCYHGVIQAYLDQVLDHDVVHDSGRINAVCQPYRKETGSRWLLFQCVHAVGHGLTSFYAHDLPRALQGCDRLEDDWDRHSCYGGAFMENVVHAIHPHHPSPHAKHDAPREGDRHASQSDFVPIKAADPLHPCSMLEERYLTDCYLMQTSIILYLNQGDMAAAARTCDGAPPAMRVSCYQSLGRDISSYTLQRSDDAIRMCSLGSADYQPWCFVGLVKNFIDITSKPESGLNFCPRVTGRANRMKCYEAVGEEIWALTADDSQRAKLCGQAEGELFEACRYGARLTPEAPSGVPIAQTTIDSIQR
jgi:hypothetical protein